jgi:hypothetical protein
VSTRLSRTEKALTDRILIGMGMADPVGVVSDEYVSAYILNPSVRGPRRLTVHEATTYPSFANVGRKHDEWMRERLSVDPMVPWWMGRFIVFAETDIVFGWTSMPVERDAWVIQTIGFDYSLARDAFGGDAHEFVKRLPRNDRLSRALLTDVLKAVLSIFSDGTGVTYRLHESQGIDPGSSSSVFPSAGGES